MAQNVSERLTYEFREEGLDKIQRDLKKLAGDFEDVGDAATEAGAKMEQAFSEADDAADDFDTRDAQKAISKVTAMARRLEDKIQDLDGERIDIEARLDVDRSTIRKLKARSVEVDADGSSSGGRLPGELDEIAKTKRLIGGLGPAAKASLAGVTALTGALAATGGLAAAALVAANKTGVLEDEIDGLKAQGKATARDFAQTFAPMLKRSVLPTLRNLLELVRQTDDELADFTSWIFNTLRSLENAAAGRQGGLFNQLGAQFIQRGVLGMLQQQTGDIPFVPNRSFIGLLSGAVPRRGTQQGRGPAARIKNRLRSVKKALKQARKEFAIRDVFGVEKTSSLQEKISTLEKLRDKLIKTRAAVDIGKAPEQWKRLDNKIRDLQDSLEGARARLEALRTEPPPAPTVKRVRAKSQVISPNVQIPSFRQVAPKIAALTRLQGKLERISSMPFLPQSAKAQKRLQQVVATVRQLQSEGRLMSKKALKGFLKDLGLTEEQIKRILKLLKQTTETSEDLGNRLKQSLQSAGVRALTQSFRALGSAIAGAKNTADKLKRIFTSLLKTAGSILLRIGVSTGNPALIAGGGLASIFGGAVSSMDTGGKILSDGIAKVHQGEAVLPKGLTSSLEGMTTDIGALTRPNMPSVKPATTSINAGGEMSLQGGAARIEGDRITIPISVIGEAVAQHRQVEQRVGRKGR